MSERDLVAEFARRFHSCEDPAFTVVAESCDGGDVQRTDLIYIKRREGTTVPVWITREAAEDALRNMRLSGYKIISTYYSTLRVFTERVEILQ